MHQVALHLGTPITGNEESRYRDQIGFWLFVLVLCLLPIERFTLPLRLGVVDSVVLLLTLYGLLRAWQMRQRLEFPLLLPIWLILLSSVVATLVGLAYTDSIMAIVQEIYLFVWFIALTNVLCTFPISVFDRLLKVWSLIACVEATTTLLGMFRIGPTMFYASPLYELSLREGPARAIGTFLNANAAAVYLAVSFFVLLATSWPHWLKSMLAGWLLVGIFGTGSNGALMSTLGALVVLVMVHSMTKRREQIMLWGGIVGLSVGILALLLFIAVLWFPISPELGLESNGRIYAITLGRISGSLAERMDLIDWAWKTYIRNPWGTGPNSFSLLRASLHNDYFAFLFERGPIGGIGWLWIVGATLLTPLRVANRLVGKRERWQVLALGAGFLACAVNAFSHEISHTRQVWMLLVFLFALCYASLGRQSMRSLSGAGQQVTKELE